MNKHFFAQKLFLMAILAVAWTGCDDGAIHENQPLANQNGLPEATVERHGQSLSALYGNFVKVLRDIESDSIMGYPEFEEAWRGTNDEERDALVEEINEALAAMAEPETAATTEVAVEGSCKSNVTGDLKHARFDSLGKQRARMSWSKKARKKYGKKYRKWSKAKSKDYHDYVDGTDYLLFKNRAYGIPCK